MIHYRLLALTGVDDGEVQRDLKVQTLRRLVLLHLCVQEWFVWLVASNPPYSKTVVLGCASAFTLSLVFGWRVRWSQAAFGFALAIAIVRTVNQFPFTANHQYLELGILALGTLFNDRKAGEAQLLLQSCRWLVVAVFFWAGLQKALHGYYFQGEFLSYAITQEPRFAQIFSRLLPSEEFIRLQSFGRPAPLGAGPFRAESWPLLLLSNLTYLMEIGVALGLLVRRIRQPALWTGLMLIVAIEVAAREVLFGALYIGLILLFAPRALNWSLFPVFVCLYSYLLAAGFGWVPTWGAH